MASNLKEMTLKLVVDGGSKKVLFAEAKKDFVDFLFGLLRIPIGSITSLLTQNDVQMSGSLDSVSRSVSDLETSHFHPNFKEYLLKPIADDNQTPLSLQVFGRWKGDIRFQSLSSGYLKDNFSYMVTDDLEVRPLSTIPLFALLEKFNIKDNGILWLMTVKIDLKKGLELVKASMESKTVLTDVFIPK